MHLQAGLNLLTNGNWVKGTKMKVYQDHLDILPS